MRRRVLLLLALGLPLVSCPKPPPPDFDGTREEARRLSLNQRHADQLHCAMNDCADWYRTATREEGTLRVIVSGQGAGVLRFDVLLEDAIGRPIDRAHNFGQSDVRLSSSVRASSYYIAIAANDSPEALLYTVRTEFEPLPPPPPKPVPQFEPHPTAVLEIIGFGDNPEAVLIELGARQGMRRGLRGRLLTGERELGTIVIDEVYSDGSRARVEGDLSSPITVETTAEIDVPVGESRALDDEVDP